MTARFLTIALALAAAGSAFADTSLVTWSSSRSTALDAVPSKLRSAKFLDHVLNNDQLCNFDAIVLIDQPSVVNRAPSSHITRSISSAASARSFKLSGGSINLSNAAQTLSSRCGARFLNYSPGPSSSGDVSLEEGKKHVLCLTMPKSKHHSDAESHESTLAAELETISSVFPSHFIFYTGPGLSNLQVRQAPDSISRPIIDVTNNTTSQQPVNSLIAQNPTTSPFFTTGLITGLLIVFFVLLPGLMIGVSALASIQTPTRMDVPKGYNAVERKNQ